MPISPLFLRRARAPSGANLGQLRVHMQPVLTLARKVGRELNAENIVRIQNLDDAQTILEPMARREPRDYYSNRSSARLRRLSGGGTRLSPEVRNRLPERVVIDAADHISSFSDLEMKTKYSLAARGASEVSSWVGSAMVRDSW